MLQVAHVLLIPFIARVVGGARIGADVATKIEADLDLDKEDSGDQSNVYILFNSSHQQYHGYYGNAVGRLVIGFRDEATLTTQGFGFGNAAGWQDGMILGKADEYVWPIQPDQGSYKATGFTFDHGVSDLVLGDADARGQRYRPEFEEVLYIRSGHESPQGALEKQRREEQKESLLKVGQWQHDGYLYRDLRGRSTLRYTPRLKLKDGDKAQFHPMNTGSAFSTISLERPHILDIDNLFSMKPVVPRSFRDASKVENDRAYVGAGGAGYGRRSFEARPGQGRRSAPSVRSGKGLFGIFLETDSQDHDDSDSNKDSGHPAVADSSENPTVANSSDDVGFGVVDSPRRSGSRGERKALSKRGVTSSGLAVKLDVEWLTPVLQRFQCVSVSPLYSKVGATSLFIAMGWDTESGMGGDLDLDVSLVPFDRYKRVIQSKMVFYNQKAPRALACGYNQYGMQAFVDDRSGDMPGDDELVKINLGCLNHQHPDIDAIVVIANIFKPAQLTWNKLDSAYMRIISGGQEGSVSGNFVVQNAEAVRSFIRLSGNDLKEDPSLGKNGLAVGMFFRQPQGGWAFANLNMGVDGRNAPTSIPHLQRELADLAYPANQQWDQTREHQDLIRKGDFGQAGFHSKALFTDQIANGQLPCVAQRRDQANLFFGRMTPGELKHISEDRRYGDARSAAQAMLADKDLYRQYQGLAQKTREMEKTNSYQKRQEIASQTYDDSSPNEEESNEAKDALKALYGIA